MGNPVFLSAHGAKPEHAFAVDDAITVHGSHWAERHYERAVDQLVEESSELIHALMKHRRSPSVGTEENIVEELADVVLQMELVLRHFEISKEELFSIVAHKAQLVSKRLGEGSADSRLLPRRNG